MKKQKMLVVAAHVGDFVWRSGGAIAKYAAEGHEVYLIVLSYGLRGESNGYWKQPGGDLEECRRIRIQEGQKAAALLGVTHAEFWDFEDYPLAMDRSRVERLAMKFREIRPDFIITHDKESDVFNPDHDLTSESVRMAYTIASGAGADCGGLPVSPRQTPMFGFEPHMTEICNFKPGIYLDITDVFDKKLQAMEACGTQKNMVPHYIRKAEIRASECANRGGVAGCKYAEAFTIWNPICSYDHFVW